VLALTTYTFVKFLHVRFGMLVYTPTLRTQIRLIDSGAGDTDEYGRLARRGPVVGIVLAVDVIAIVFLMVTKPLL